MAYPARFTHFTTTIWSNPISLECVSHDQLSRASEYRHRVWTSARDEAFADRFALTSLPRVAPEPPSTCNMAPFFSILTSRHLDYSQSPNEFRDQWTRPSDVFSVLLILGGDVVARAMAQVVGSRPTTVAFSFGRPNVFPSLLSFEVCKRKSWSDSCAQDGSRIPYQLFCP